VIRGICDRPERIAARVYVALRSDCPCCTAYRFFALGVVLGAAIATVAALLT
jgi:hypothetical protein